MNDQGPRRLPSTHRPVIMVTMATQSNDPSPGPGRRGVKGPWGSHHPVPPEAQGQAQAQPPGAGAAHLDGVFNEDHSLVQAQVPPSRSACGQREHGG